MRIIKDFKSWDLPMRLAGVTIVVFCAGGIAAFTGWVPKAVSASDNPTPIEVSAAPARSGGVTTDVDLPQAPNNGGRTARCAECGIVESIREIADPAEATSLVRCGFLGNPVERIAGSDHNAENVDVATLVAWHVYARTGLGCADEGTLVPSVERSLTTHYEVIVLFRDGSRRAIRDVVNESRVPTWRLGDRVKVMTDVIS